MKGAGRILRGRALVLGDNMDTDLIIAGRYCRGADPKELARHVFESLDGKLASRIRKGDIIVAGRNFGCGSSREQAPLALKAAGVRAIAAESFARIFFRNALNIGLPVLAIPDARKIIKEWERITVDIGKGELAVPRTGERRAGRPLPPFLLEMLEDGGLVPHLKRRLKRDGKI